jgi:hypothetical protein
MYPICSCVVVAATDLRRGSIRSEEPVQSTTADTPHLEQRAIAALVVLSLFLGVLPQFYEPLGWSGAHRTAGTLLAAAVFGLGAAIAKPVRRRGLTIAANFVMAAALVGALVLPYALHEGLALAARPDPVAWPHGDLFAVPKLATEEPVRGTGCGADPNSTRVTESTIPDGTWFGAVRSVDGAASLSFDLMCAYPSEADAESNPAYNDLDAAGQIIRHPSENPTWVAMNASKRVRTVPLAERFRFRDGAWSASGDCLDGGKSVEIRTDVPVWLVIQGGHAVLAERLCDL